MLDTAAMQTSTITIMQCNKYACESIQFLDSSAKNETDTTEYTAKEQSHYIEVEVCSFSNYIYTLVLLKRTSQLVFFGCTLFACTNNAGNTIITTNGEWNITD